MIDLGAVPQYGRIEVALNEARVRRLQERSGNALGVAMGAGAGRWTLSAAEFVGSLVVDDMRVLIRPIYIRAGILPEIAGGVEVASELTSPRRG